MLYHLGIDENINLNKKEPSQKPVIESQKRLTDDCGEIFQRATFLVHGKNRKIAKEKWVSPQTRNGKIVNAVS